MQKLFTFRSGLSLALMFIAMNALVSGIKTGVLEVTDAAFWPVAAFAVTLSYLLGSTTISARRAWSIIMLSGLFVIYIEAARIHEPLVNLLKAIPQIQFDLLRSLLEKESPDISLLESLFTVITGRSSLFFTNLFEELSGSVTKQTTLREVLWDLPLLFLPAWAGWWTRKHNNILAALAPSLALHGYILYYTNKSTLSLQVSAFALIFLLGINQKWNLLPQESEASEKTAKETYSTVVVLAFALAIVAGLMPSISIKEAAQKLTDKARFSETLGLERAIVQNYNLSSSGLPLQHLVGRDPATLRTIVFVANTCERPFLDVEDPEDAPQVPRHYWRWAVYDVYNGRSWTSSPAESISYGANESLFPLKGEQYKIVHQTIEKASPQDNHLYWTGSLGRANQPFESSWRIAPRSLNSNVDPLLASDMLGSLTQKQVYSADSLVPILSEEQLRASSHPYPQDIRARYLSLPKTIPERVLQLARDLTSNMDNPYDKARSIEAYLRTYPYSLDVPPPPAGRDTADYFLFDLKTGYCDYYATSMIVLARAAGLPARLVIGYSSGDYDRINAEYVVREMHAHSWVEVYYTGIGWVEFEPTAGRPVITLPVQAQDGSQSLIPFTQGTDRRQIAYTKNGAFPKINYAHVSIALAIIISFSGLRFLRTQGLLRAHPSIGSMYEYVYFHGRKIYKDGPIHETPSNFAEELKKKLAFGYAGLRPAGAEIEYLTKLYLQETYSPHPINTAERRQAAKVWRKLFWRLLYARSVRL